MRRQTLSLLPALLILLAMGTFFNWKVVRPLIPAALALVMGAVTVGVARLSGRAPNGLEAKAGCYLEAPVEVCLARLLQRRWFDAALLVEGGRLALYTFGTPLLSLPLAGLAGQTALKTGWFGTPYLEFDLTGNPGLSFHKDRLFFRMLAGTFRLRLYSRDGQRLRFALGI